VKYLGHKLAVGVLLSGGANYPVAKTCQCSHFSLRPVLDSVVCLRATAVSVCLYENGEIKVLQDRGKMPAPLP